jgi:hypothetical protein
VSPVDQWRQKAVIEEIGDQVMADMETAGKVVEVDARRRLLSIQDPEFGRGYRRVLAMFRLTSFVRRAGSVIEALVGIPKGDKGGDYGFWIEMGSKTAAAHPWLRPALLTNLTRIKEFLGQ